MSSTFKQDQAKLQRRPSESDLPAQLHGCPLALLLPPTGMTRERLKEAPQDEGNEEEHDCPEGHWCGRSERKSFRVWVSSFLMREIKKTKLERKCLWENSHPKTVMAEIFSRSPVFRSAYYIWLSCTAQLCSQKLLKAFLLRRAILRPIHLPWKTGFPPSEAEPLRQNWLEL